GTASSCRSHRGGVFFFSSRRRHTRFSRDWSSDGVLFRSKAQELAGTDAVTAAQVRDGFEALDISEERLAELGLTDFSPAIKTSRSEERRVGKESRAGWGQ